MKIQATIENRGQNQEVLVSTEGAEKTLSVPVKATGKGSAVNGGELLFLSLATCFCNDVYREAAKRSMQIESVAVTVRGEFGSEGQPAANIVYETKIEAPAHTAEELSALIKFVDEVAEVHNTLRQGVSVKLKA